MLPAGSEPATTIDDVALDVPGRDRLVAVIDVDNPNETTTTTAAPTTVAATTTPGATTMRRRRPTRPTRRLAARDRRDSDDGSGQLGSADDGRRRRRRQRARPVRSRSGRPPSPRLAVAPPSSPAVVPPDRPIGVSGARTVHVTHSDGPQHSDGAGQELISRVVVAVTASKSLIRTRIDISQVPGSGMSAITWYSPPPNGWTIGRNGPTPAQPRSARPPVRPPARWGGRRRRSA